ncbi:MAG: DUF2796 domain-containing protein [Gammaproteobacteria bacterium]|nr:DUF2796 domain-containing protein [Gammaproteobacteria bacterium]
MRTVHPAAKLTSGVVVAGLLIVGVTAAVAGPHAHDEHSHDDRAHDDHGHRQHGAHVHGQATLSIAIDGARVEVALESPAANLFGFEHRPKTAADKAAVAAATQVLGDGERLFRFDAGAGCRLVDAEIESSMLGSDSHQHHHDGDAHADDTHADVAAHYRFDCSDASRIREVGVELFAHFERLERLDVQFVTSESQGAARLSQRNTVVSF